MILSESPLSQRAAEETLPLRDAFAVIFFVSVGMLFKPAILIEDPLAAMATLAIILLGKSLAAFAIIRLFGYPASTALLVSVSLAQIGEFSFILAGLGVDLGLLPERGRNLILAGAILSILLNPLLFAGLDMLQAWREKRHAPEVKPRPHAEESAAREPVRPTALTNHVVLVGHGRVGSVISEGLTEKKVPLLVIENDDERLVQLKAQGIEAIAGNAADPGIIAAANLGVARCLLVAIPDAFEGGQVVEQARVLSPRLNIIARAHSEAEVLHLKKHGASVVILGEHEIARAMVALVSAAEA
jgi:CPA2 family monovalent cation:H+ antiporter-2